MTEKEGLDLRYVISKGYIKIPWRKLREGKVVSESKGGFIEDWDKGRLWVLIDVEKFEVVEFAFELSKLERKAEAYMKQNPGAKANG